MSELGDKLKVVLANTFAMYLKTHNFHWNVEGPDFSQYHAFFEGLYNELWLASDAIAEHIRAINEYAPGSFKRFSELATIDDELNIPEAMSMFQKLSADNDKVIASIRLAYDAANDAAEIGLSNFLQDRTDIHKKHGWMLRSIVKRL